MNRLLLLITLLLCGLCNAWCQQGKDSAQIISTPKVLNEYTMLTTDATAGSSSITVVNSTLNVMHRYTQSLSSGDLLLIIQMQGATILGNVNDSTWGTILNYNNCGLYEFAEVTGVTGSTIYLACRLQHNYTATGIVQVVRVPRLSSLTVNSGGTLTCDAWNGLTGGIVAVEVRDSTTIQNGGAIDVSGKGFRGGQIANNASGSTGLPINQYYSAAQTIALGGAKGEGIAGFGSAYNQFGGAYCRGAAANAGGGGNWFDCPGGGGANAGNINDWTGKGNPDTTSSYIPAWNLEYNGFASSTSSGGGRGGYGSGYPGPSPFITGPDNCAWGNCTNDSRPNGGGFGGRPLDYSTGRLFIGGGGGAGYEDNNNAGSGGAGGGLIFITSYSTVSGNGQILANGTAGGNDANEFGDGPGGGGTVIISSSGTISGITINANGGNGGNQTFTDYSNFEGGGGGGSGGYIALTNAGVACFAKGGANGITHSSSISAFPPNGATSGGAGFSNEIYVFSPLDDSSSQITISNNSPVCAGETITLTANGGITYQWANGLGTNASITVSPITTTTYSVTAAVGANCYATASQIVIVNQPAVSQFSQTICSGGSFTFNGRQLTQAGSYNDTLQAVSGCDSIVTLTLIVNPPVPAPVLSTGTPAICASDSALINTSGSYASYLWNTGATDSFIYAVNAGNYYVTVTDQNNCTAESNHLAIAVYSSPPVSVSVNGDTFTAYNAATYQWYWNNNPVSGATNAVYIATNPGSYTVLITDGNNCSALSSPIVIQPTGITAITDDQLRIYPLPAESYITIEINGGLLNGVCKVTDMSGKIIAAMLLQSTNTYLPINNWASGIYTLSIQSITGATITRQFIVQ